MSYISEFMNACRNGHLEVVKTLSLQIEKKLETSYSFVSVLTCYKCAFATACKFGQLEVAKWLVHKDPSVCDDFAFRIACANGHLEVARWLLESYPQINIFAYDNFAFIYACSGSHLEVAKWLVEIQPYHYMIELDPSQTHILNWRIRSIQEIRWLKRAVPVLAYNSKTLNVFQMLNYDTVRHICGFV